MKYRIVEAPHGLDRVFYIQRKRWFWWENLVVNSSVISHKVLMEVSHSFGQSSYKYGRCKSELDYSESGGCFLDFGNPFWFYSLRNAQACLEAIKTGLEFDRAQKQREKNALTKNSKKGKRVHEVHVV